STSSPMTLPEVSTLIGSAKAVFATNRASNSSVGDVRSKSEKEDQVIVNLLNTLISNCRCCRGRSGLHVCSSCTGATTPRRSRRPLPGRLVTNQGIRRRNYCRRAPVAAICQCELRSHAVRLLASSRGAQARVAACRHVSGQAG